MRTAVLAFILGALVARPPAVQTSAADVPGPSDDADVRFVIELCERANDRIIDGIRVFNMVAYTLLGPLLAIAAFVDYRDPRNLAPLSLAVAAVAATVAVLRAGEGIPTPNLADKASFDMFDDDVERAQYNILRDLRRSGEVSALCYRRKRTALSWAGRFVILAILVTIAVKGVESSEMMPPPSPRPVQRTVQTTAAAVRIRRGVRHEFAPGERHSLAYDPATGRTLTDVDLDVYLERAKRPWWRFW